MKSSIQILTMGALMTASLNSSFEILSQEPPRLRDVQNSVSATLEMQSSIRNGIRSITATQGDQKVEIQDSNGKNITLKLTKIVGGKPVIKEYKADDLEALKLKSVDAADLYEKYTKRPNLKLQGLPRVPVPVGLIPRVPLTDPFAVEEDQEPSSIGPRKIRVHLEDRKIEIEDNPRKTIRVKIIRVVDGIEKTEEFTGKNLPEFKKTHPEIGRLYEKYTGITAE